MEAMIPYFQNPDAMRVAVQSHTAHLLHPVCSALSNIQILPNGDVLACYGIPPIGNIRTTPIREIWHNRSAWWLLYGAALHHRRKRSTGPYHDRRPSRTPG
jgi:MoaA/NifB/PqqE/SkfB family radical SAM enzyme